jgi:methylated-DNA-[protein]-cysteine S-methyltransferase
MRLWLERHHSPIGTILTVTDDEGNLRALDFSDFEARMHRLLRAHDATDTLKTGAGNRTIAQCLAAYFDGQLGAITKPIVKTGGTPFQRDVWAALRTIPAGTTMSYGELAARLGRPGASRAVGLANGSNPVAIMVPCHRVIGANGALTGYGGGLLRKRWLLEHELRHTRRDAKPLFVDRGITEGGIDAPALRQS